jgi:hypothetical protein
MEILIQSVLQKVVRLGSSVHIRYSERNAHPPATSGDGKKVGMGKEREGDERMTSYVILRKPYTYLEPVVRAMFAEAEDVEIMVDRRWHERRQGRANGGTEDRRNASNRRLSTPMLDILINVED